jgi:hypothetical protein
MAPTGVQALVLTGTAKGNKPIEDGDLFGLMPSRQGFSSVPHIVVDGNTVEVMVREGGGPDWSWAGVTLAPGFYGSSSEGRRAVCLAGRLAQIIHGDLNGDVNIPIVHTIAGLQEGVPVVIYLQPGDYSGGSGINFNDNTFNYGMLANERVIHWSRGWGLSGLAPDIPNNGRPPRDIVFVGQGLNATEVLFPRIQFSFNPNNGSYPGQVDNVRFERVTIQNTNQDQTVFGGVNDGGNLNDHPNADALASTIIVDDMQPITPGNGWADLGSGVWSKTNDGPEGSGFEPRFRDTNTVIFDAVENTSPLGSAAAVNSQGEWHIGGATGDTITLFFNGSEAITRRKSAGSTGCSRFTTDRDPLLADGEDYDVWINTATDTLFYKGLTGSGSEGWSMPDGVGQYTALRAPKTNYQGTMKFYDCDIKGQQNVFDWFGCGQKQGIRMQAYCTGLDVRGTRFWAVQEHCIYMDSPQGFLYVVNCTQDTPLTPTPPDDEGNGGLINATTRVGGGNTFCQVTSRLVTHAGHAPDRDARILFIRCTIQNNLTTHGIGGSDITIWGGFDGIVSIIDCDLIGSAVPWGPEMTPGSAQAEARGGLNFTQERGWDGAPRIPQIPKGATVFETSSGSGIWYSTYRIEVIRCNLTVNGNRRNTANMRCVGQLVLGFTNYQCSNYRPQIRFNGDQDNERIFFPGFPGVPYRPNLTPADGAGWGVSWRTEMFPVPSSEPPWLQGDGSGAFNVSATVKLEHRSILDITDLQSVSDAQLDAYTGADPT